MFRTKCTPKIAVATPFVAILLAHLPLIARRSLANVDEGYAASIAQRLLDGRKLYVGAISQRGPLMYYLYEGLARVARWDNVTGIRIAALMVTWLTVAATYRAASEPGSGRFTALAAAVLYSICLTLGIPGAYDALALNGELLLAPLFVAGVWLSGRAAGDRDRGRPMEAFAGALLLALAACIKQVAIPNVAFACFALFVSSLGSRRRWLAFGASVVGAVLPPLFFVSAAAHDGTLKAFVYYTLTYNLSVHSQAKPGGVELRSAIEFAVDAFPLVLGGLFVWGCTLARRAFDAVSRQRSVKDALEAWDAGTYRSVQGVIAMGVALGAPQQFSHYLLPGLALVCQDLAVAFEPLLHRLAERKGEWSAAALLGVMALAGGAGAFGRFQEKHGLGAHDEGVLAISRYVNEHTAATDKVYVWGFSPWIYVYGHRKAASRYPFVTYATGFVPWFWNALYTEPQRVVPGAMENLVEDLETERPELIVDAGYVQILRPMRSYRGPYELLQREYCFEARVGSYDVYRRKHGACARPCFPSRAVTKDYFGYTLRERMPRELDAASSHNLPTIVPPSDSEEESYEPVTFDDRTCPAERADAPSGGVSP